LTQTNRVFIVEPCLNPAIESQAIGRVYRLGQKRPVEIVRLIMQDSVEHRIRTMLQNKYGTASSTSIVPVDGNHKKPAPGSHAEALIGCLQTEKNTIVADEFDLLYGVQDDEDQQDGEEAGAARAPPPPPVNNAAAAAVPDTMLSLMMPPSGDAASAASMEFGYI
jgi:hypothetical protein